MSNTPVSDNFLSEGGGFDKFIEKVSERLKVGKEEYGDKSFRGPLKLQEIQDELEDVAGWASIQWEKLERLKRHMLKTTNDQIEIDKAMVWVEETIREVYNVWDDGDLSSL